MTSSDVDASNHNCSASVASAVKQNVNKQKRSVKRDRHSKILTAQGVRDRRMRLSLEVASEFFGLQDLRDDDKPSKTIRWLLNQCKGAIKELVRVKEMERNKKCRDRANSGVSSTSECEVMSGMEETSNERDREGMGRNKEGKREKKQPRKTKFHPIGKESREKARARARERTIEKKRGKRTESGAEMIPKKVLSSSPSETGEESGASQSHSQQSHDMKSSMAVAVVVEELSSHSLLDLQGPNQKTVEEEEHLLTTNKTSESSIFSFQHEIAITQGLIASTTSTKDNNVPSFFENWDIDGSRAHSCYCNMNNPYPSTGNLQERRASSSVFQTTSEIHLQCHLSDVQNFGKPWEVYNMN